MATVYSLICYGGSAGLTATMSIATPCVVTVTDNVPNTGTGVRFSTTGALPTGVTANQPYYARYVSKDTFHLYDTYAHAIDTGSTTGRVNTSGTQSGTHTIKGEYYLGLTEAQTARYGSRIYATPVAWNSGRTTDGVGLYDSEIGEIGDAFICSFAQSSNACCKLDLACANQTLTTLIDGVRSAGFHGRVTGAGFIIRCSGNYADYGVLQIPQSVEGRIIDGVSVYVSGNNVTGIMTRDTLTARNIIRNCLIYGVSSYNQFGILAHGIANTYHDNIVHTISGSGIRPHQYTGNLSEYYNNVVCKCTTGFYGYADSTCAGRFRNNISVGNTTNWGTEPGGIVAGAYNFGETGNSPWEVGAATSGTMATTDFADYTNNNFSPAAETSPQVMNGANVFGGDADDAADKSRPAYVDVTHRFDYDNEASGPFDVGERLSWGSGGTAGTGVLLELTDDGTTGSMAIHLTSGAAPVNNTAITGAESSATCDVNGTPEEPTGEWVPAPRWSAGPIEYDFGGPAALVTVTLQNVVDGSRYWVYNNDTSTVLGTGVQSGSADILIENVPYSGSDESLTIRVRRSGATEPDYLPFETNATLTENGATVWVSQVEDPLQA